MTAPTNDPKPEEPSFVAPPPGPARRRWFAAVEAWTSWHERNPHPYVKCPCCWGCTNCPQYEDAPIHIKGDDNT